MKYKLSRYLLQKVSDTFGNLVSLKRFGTVPDCTASGSCRSRGCLKAMNERKKIAKKNLKVIEHIDIVRPPQNFEEGMRPGMHVIVTFGRHKEFYDQKWAIVDTVVGQSCWVIFAEGPAKVETSLVRRLPLS